MLGRVVKEGAGRKGASEERELDYVAARGKCIANVNGTKLCGVTRGTQWVTRPEESRGPGHIVLQITIKTDFK